ncbi:MAG TPA: hypothetical protein VN372_01535 [Methanospirillum sp.]|nr:hypothetical protein [Methanospirillum sp.]
MGQIPDRTDHDRRKHRSHPRITGNATITGAMGSGVSASRDSSEDTFSKTHVSCREPRDRHGI